MDIRPARPDDAPQIRGLINALIPTTTIEWTDEPRSDAYVERWLADHEVVLVAEDPAGELVGVAAFGWFRDVVARPGYRFAVENTIHVREDRWRSGVATALMTALIAAARSAGKHSMIAAIDGANESSIRLHERVGFELVARIPQVGAKFGEWLDLVLMQRMLDDRPSPPQGVAAS